ncbi:MAG: WecB/TagA/CpsF family glycosyltransferase [Oscillospiraceae bacterium]|jgi:N-acetylglucosaminyldiphosphoundecaprenol N-acetyl-beta-D-mannosaminyltransferase|nr:WecB/TagA/CpsF family glycosyltransferase [Oscillospiraceae bacterium]
MDTRVDVLGVGFDCGGIERLTAGARAILARARAAGTAMPYVVTPNPEIVMLARDGDAYPGLMSAVNNAALVVPDGIGVIYGAKILAKSANARKLGANARETRPPLERVPGIDFAWRLMTEDFSPERRVFLLGARAGVAAQAGERLSAQLKGLNVVGARDGYFTDDDEVVAEINAAKPDLLLVCLGAPKQELWVARNASRLNAGLALCLGGALDVWAGVVPRAPKAFRRLGLEWLYRLLREPRRIGRMMKLPLFIFAAVGQRLSKK